jgi:hypothetical protein
MFRPTNPQLSLMESRFLVSPAKRARLERSWAEVFRSRILPLIDEEIFRPCFCKDNGRPNTSIRLLVGLHILKEADDLTDEQILDALEFNLQWQHALGVEPADAHVCEKTLHNFRHRLMEDARAQAVFEKLTAALMKVDGLSAVRQRLDSTHVISNIAVLTRLGLFTETITSFLRELRKEAPEKLAKLDGEYTRRYLDRAGYFADVQREQARRRLGVVGQDLYGLVTSFEQDASVSTWPSYALLVRLLSEQCDVLPPEAPEAPVPVPPAPNPPAEPAAAEIEASGPDAETGLATTADPAPVAPAGTPSAAPVVPAPVVLREGKEITGASLQSPHDPDATYGHKGKGYEAQLAETCVEGNPYQVVTAVQLTPANGSDQKALLPMVERLVKRDLAPDVMLADTGYGSGENIAASASYRVVLLAPVQDAHAPDAPDVWERPVGAPAAPSSPEATPSGPMGLDAFSFNAEYSAVVACPAGVAPRTNEVTEAARPYRATFGGETCAACPLADRCPTRIQANTGGDRVLDFRDVRAATETRQREQQTPAFKKDYRLRSGIESTNAELKGRHGAGDLRVRGRARVELAVTLKAMALNVKRAVQHHVETLRADLAGSPAVSMGPA